MGRLKYVSAFIFVLTLVCLAADVSAQVDTLTVETLEKYLAMIYPENTENMTGFHDLRIPPLPENGDPVEVKVGVYINALGDIDEMDMEFMMNMYLRHEWFDYRLAFGDDITTDGSLSLPDAFFKDKIWTPDTYFINSKTEQMHDQIKDNWSFRIYRNGRIYFSQRLSVTAWCFLYLYRFPLEQQTCKLSLATYRYKTTEMVLKWMDSAPLEHGVIQLARNKLLYQDNLHLGDCTTFYTQGNFSCVYVDLTYQRLFGYYLIQIYIPSGLIVLLSWVSFYLDPLAVPGRISLGVLTILTMSTQMASAATASLPKVSYVTGIDVWLTTCMCFLFSALVEFAVVNSMARVEFFDDGVLRRPSMVAKALTPSDIEVLESKGKKFSGFGDLLVKKWGSKAAGIDMLARFAFPGVFLGFNTIYWMLYTIEAFYHIVDKSIE